MPQETPPRVLPVEAVAALRRKGYQIGFDWRDVWQEEHARAFTVAKAMTTDLLQDIREAVDTALAEGQTLAMFRRNLAPTLWARGWWGKSLQTDPLTGEEKLVELGSPRRLKTIFETNMRTAYQAGRWERIEREKATFPFLRYRSVGDERVRDQHAAWDDTILPVDDPWWDTHYPPCDWGCRCTATPLNERTIKRRGLAVTQEPVRFPDRTYVNKRTGEITRLERGIGPGWAYNVGKAPNDGLVPPLADGGAGEEDAAHAALSNADYEALRPVLAPFGLADRAAMLRGRIWRDAAGWPHAISAGLFRQVDGRIVIPARLRLVARALVALRDPDEIYLVWMKQNAQSKHVLVRRYIRQGSGVVDIARGFWRWAAGTGKLARFARGTRLWSREEGEAAAYDPRQPRGADGRWSSRSGKIGGSVAASQRNPQSQEKTSLGRAGPNAPEGMENYERLFSAETTRKVLRDHGIDGRRGDRHPITEKDFELIPVIASKGKTRLHSSKRPGRRDSVSYTLDQGGSTIVYVESVGRKRQRLISKSLYRK